MSLRDEIKAVKQTNSEAGVNQISASDLKPGPSKHPDLSYSLNTHLNTQSNTRTSDEPMESFVGLRYHHSSFRGCSLRSDQIRTPNNLSLFVQLG